MLEERCWRSDAGRLRLQQWHQSHHGISAPTHQGASICKQRRAAVLTFRGGCSGCCSWIRRSYLAFIIGVISSQPSAADAPSRRAAEDEQGQENDEGLGHIGSAFPSSKISCRKGLNGDRHVHPRVITNHRRPPPPTSTLAFKLREWPVGLVSRARSRSTAPRPDCLAQARLIALSHRPSFAG